MPVNTIAGVRRRQRSWRVLRLALILVAMSPFTWTNAGAAPPARIAHAASPTYTFSSNPTDAPPGATITVYAYGFNSRYINVPVSIVFGDASNTVLATTMLVTCDSNPGTGFGTQCNGQAQYVTIPPDATPGSHNLIMRVYNTDILSPFTVDPLPTATDTATDTATSTATATATSTKTATATNTATPSVTATDTVTATPSSSATGVQLAANTLTSTPSWTSTTVPQAGTPTLTAAPLQNTSTATVTPTIVSQPPVLTQSITVSQLQRVTGGCTIASRAVGVLRAGTLSAKQNLQTVIFQGGQRVTLNAARLPANAVVDLVINAPRAVVSGQVSAAINYSPPVVQARTDSRGALAASLVLPNDLAAGNGQIQAFLHTAPRGNAHPTLLTTWSFTGAPADPIVQVSVLDAAGRPIRGASVTFLPSGSLSASGISLARACGRVSDAGGNAVFSRVPSGSGQVIVSSKGRFIGSAAPKAVQGAIIAVRLHDKVHDVVLCAKVQDPLQALTDQESGGNGATSGDGPFGTFVSGVRTMDNFTGLLTSDVALNTPVTLSFVDSHGAPALSANGFIAQAGLGGIRLGTRTLGLGGLSPGTGGLAYAPHFAFRPLAVSALSVNSGSSQYLLKESALNVLNLSLIRQVVFPPIDLGKLGPGNWYASVTLGSNSHCPSLFPLKMIANPWRTPLGTIQPIYDRVDHAYYASEQLPNSGAGGALLHFQRPHVDIGWNDYEVAGIVTVPHFHIPFPDLASSDLGIDVNERLYTNGNWDGTLTAHAHVKMLGISLVDRQMPTFPGKGTNITRDGIALFDYRALDNQLIASVPLVDMPMGFPGVAGAVFEIKFNMHGVLDVHLDVAAVLDSITFTFDPAMIAGLEASAHVDFLRQSAGLSLSGKVTLQVPVTVAIPGGVSAAIAVRFGVGGHAYVHFCFVECTGPEANFTIIPTFCVLGDCSAAPVVAALGNPRRAGGTLTAGRHTYSFTPMSPNAVTGAARIAAKPSPPPSGTIRARPQPATYPAQPAIAISPSGQKAAMWVTSAGGRVRLFAAMGDGQPHEIASSGAQIAQPLVAWIGANQAVAVWVGNTASAAQIAAVGGASARNGYQALVQALSHQELYSATWNGAAWSAPRRLTHDNFVDSEPALAGDPLRHTATLAWVHAVKNDTLQHVLSTTQLYVSTYAHGAWTAGRAVSGTTSGGLHEPAVAIDARGHVALAWVAGAGMSAITTIAVDGQRSARPLAMPGFPRGAAHLSLAFDGDGHLVLAADGPALTAARQGAAGRWTVWTLGADTQPQLIAERDGSLALASLPGNGDPLEPLGIPTLRILPRGGTFGSALSIPGTTSAAVAIAVAADPRTGSVQALVQNASIRRAANTATRIVKMSIMPNGQLGLVRGGLRLDPPQPRPGTRARLLVQVRNMGFASLRPGALVVVRVGPSGPNLRLPTSTALAPGATATLVGLATVPQAAMLVTARAGRQVIAATLALPPAPTSLGSVPHARTGSLLLNWSPPIDAAIASYRVYRGAGARGPLSLAGIATATLWFDLQRAPRMTYRYQITAVDSYGRESSLSAPLIPAAS